MRTQIGIVIGLSFFFMVFILAGFPMLRDIKEDITTARVVDDVLENSSEEGDDQEHIEIIDISESEICKDTSGETDLRCLTREGCNVICEMRGCNHFGLEYNGSTYRNNCKCKCYDKEILESNQ